MRRLGSPFSFQALSFLGRVSARPPTPESPWHVRFPPMTSEVAPTTRPPLTSLSDEESMFRDAVADFAEHEVRPRVQRDGAGGTNRSDPDPAAISRSASWGSRCRSSTAALADRS